MKKIGFILILILGLQRVGGQSFNKNDVKYLSYNVISSSLTSAIGSCFHRNKNESIAKTFSKNFMKGFIGGAIDYTAKFTIKNNDFLLSSRLIHSIGQSILYNSFNNQSIISNYYLTLYCFNFQMNFHKLFVKVDPATIGFTVYLSFYNKYSFNIKQSLYTGSIVFNSFIKPIHQGIGKGQSIGNVITSYKNIDPFFKPLKYSDSDYKSNIRHEFCHNLQYNEFSIFTPNFNNKYLKHINININFLSTYFIISQMDGYENNYFEKEANKYSE